MKVDFGCQNMTEGPVTPELKGCDVVIGQEVDPAKIRAGLPSYEHAFPDPHQSISWDPTLLEAKRSGYLRFHRSGQAEHWPFATPARGLGFVKGRLTDKARTKVVVCTVWLLNSWMPVRADKHTRIRNAIGRASLVAARTRMKVWRLKGYTVVIAGDFNSLRWRGRMPGFDPIKNGGLDRAFVSKRGGLELVGTYSDGPTTGVGHQMRHKAVLFTLTTRKR